MQKRILRELSKTFPDNIEKHDLDYCVAVNSDERTINSNIGNISSLSISSDKYNCRIILNLKPDYPFKPPTIIECCDNVDSTLNNTIINSRTPSYSYWCSRILNKKDNYSILISYVFSCFSMKTMQGIPKTVPDKNVCLCCESLTCGYKWSPAQNIFTVFNECVFRKNIEKYLDAMYTEYFNEIFKNSKWTIPDELILHIIEFL
jgi:ubiquitin-protein ligase